MSKYATRLMVLQETARGLMARLAYMKNCLASPGAMGGQSGVLQNPKLLAVRRNLEKRFPEQDEVATEKNFDLFCSQAPAVVEQVRGHYHTFLDVLQFKEAALETLQQVSAKVVTFTFDSCPLLAIGFLDLLVSFVQLHILQASVGQRRLLVALYGCAYKTVHSAVEPHFSRLAAYAHAYAQPLRGVQGQLSELYRTVQEILVGLFPTYQGWLNIAALGSGNVFNPSEDPERMGLPATKPVYGALLRGERCRLWVAYGLLACPRALGADSKHTGHCQGLLRLALSDGWVLPVHRGMTLRPHDAFRALLEWFPPKTPANDGLVKKFHDLKLDKLVAELAADAAGKSGARHRQRRVFLCHEVAKLLRLVRENPGLLGPKFPAVLAAAAMIRAELKWYFLHVGQPPPKVERGWFSSAPKVEHREEDYDDHLYVPALVGLLDSLVRCSLRSARVVHKYHLEYLRVTHRAKLEALVNGSAAAASLSGFVKKVLAGAVELLGALPEDDEAVDDHWNDRLRSLRYDWLRAEMSIVSDVRSKGAAGVTAPLMQRMDLILRHASFVADGVAGQIKRFASAGSLVFHQEAVRRLFVASINGKDGQPRDCVAFLRLPHSALDNVHPYCPEEQQAFGDKACAWTDWMMTKLVDRFESALLAVSDQYRRLHQQIAPIEAAYREERSRDARRSGKGPAAKAPPPGFESKPQYRLSVAKLDVAQRKLQDLCSAIARIGEDDADKQGFVVYNRRYRPQIYLRKRAAVAFHTFLLRATGSGARAQSDPSGKRSSSRGSSGGRSSNAPAQVERPSVLLQHVRSYVAALQCAGAHMPLDADRLIRQVLLGDAFGEEFNGAGTLVAPRAIPNATRGGGSFVHLLCRWYTDFILRYVSAPRVTGICYSSFRRGFVRVPLLCSRHVVAPVAENWLDRDELAALCALIGTRGVRMLHGSLLNIVVVKTMELKKQLSKHKDKLERFAAAATKAVSGAGRPDDGGLKWDDLVTCARGIANKEARSIVTFATTIGSALCLRHELHAATRVCVRKRLPVLQSSVEIACLSKADPFSDSDMPPGLSALASDVGLPCLDGALRKALAPMGEPGVWRLLPYLVAATFVSDCWKDADYYASIDAHQNNAHVVIPAVIALLDCFTVGDVAHRAFIRSASAMLLCMKKNEKETFRDWPLRGMIILLEKFAQQSRFLDRSALEDVFPYALIHAAHVDISIGKQHGYDEGMDAARFGRMTSSGTREKQRHDAEAAKSRESRVISSSVLQAQ